MENNLNKIQAGINKIEDDNQKMIFQYKLNKLYNDYNIKIEEILDENINYFKSIEENELEEKDYNIQENLVEEIKYLFSEIEEKNNAA